jgi:nitrite reductase/ring-hydroxylating ferredoxin subunit
VAESKDVEWHRAAGTADIDEDEPKSVTVGKFQIALCKVDGKVYAIDDICTHEFASLCDGFVDGDEIECPLHQARFHIPTGKVKAPPATDDLPTYAVKVEGSDVFVGVPKS